MNDPTITQRVDHYKNEIAKQEYISHKTEMKFIGWALICPHLPECQELIRSVNVKNISVFGRMVHSQILKVIDLHPESAQYGRMQHVAFQVAIGEMKVPADYIYECLDASSCWIPEGPTQIEIEELTI